MTATAGPTVKAGVGRRAAAARWTAWWSARDLPSALAAALEVEADHRRFFLWVPAAVGSGVVLYFTADREPSLPVVTGLTTALAALAFATRRHAVAFKALVALAAILGGMAAAGWRTARLAAPVLDRVRIATVQGTIEQMDHRREGARFILRVAASDDLDPDHTPYRLRLTTRRTPEVEAGAFVELKARLLPPSRAAQPGGYDFARDAWFARIGAVGNVLGRIAIADAPEPPDLGLRAAAAIDRARNALARRVDRTVGGDAGAIAAAMVTGKRDLLSEEAKSLIREAGIFHVVTISGVQMTLVAGIFFVGLRRLLALSRTLALNGATKKWAAGAAMVAAAAYDVATGSRIGTERALLMTLIVLAAVILDRRALTMRNLALTALAVLVLEPEALLGASFQLSFAAVAALVAVYEARAARGPRDDVVVPARAGGGGGWFARLRGRRPTGHGWRQALFATFCATSATAPFMAYGFHEVNPYVLLGNPLTLTIIEVFAVPGALLGTLLTPLGLDAIVWHYVGAGIAIIMWAARLVGSLPGASLHLPAFAPWSLAFFAFAVLSAVIWRSPILRLTAVPLAAVGLLGALSGPAFDVAVAQGGDTVAVRGADGHLTVVGARPSAFDAEQWLRADADGRPAKGAIDRGACDEAGCVARLPDGRSVAVDFDPSALAEDCSRASILVTPLLAPVGCAAPLVLDRDALKRTGSVTLKAVAGSDGFILRAVRGPDEDRPWSPAPNQPWRWRTAAPRDRSPDGGNEPSAPDQ